MDEHNKLEAESQVEGRNPVLEALRSGRIVEKIFLATDAHGGAIEEIITKARQKGIIVQRVDKSNLNAMSFSGVHQGVIAATAPYDYVQVKDILEISIKLKQPSFVVILDGITDPYNLGAILRTAECVGAHGVIIPKRRAAGLTPVVVKASAGALEYIAVAKVSNIASTIEELKKQGLWIIGADVSGATYTQQDFSIPMALVIGGEGKGISRLVKEKCDFLTQIPLKGKIESLNASVAAAILMYEVVRQRI